MPWNNSGGQSPWGNPKPGGPWGSPPPPGGGGGPPGMMVMAAGNNAGMEAQIRQRMAARMKEDFAPFRDGLDYAQRAKWDVALSGLVNARRTTVYRLVDGKAEPVMVRVGASDGSSTEISGRDIAEGDVVIAGEQSAPESK